MGFRIFLDENGLPWSDYGNYKGMDIGVQNSILYVSEWGLLLWKKWIYNDDIILLSSRWWKKIEDRKYHPRSKEQAEKQILHCASWLVDRIISNGYFAVWVHPYEMSFGMKPGWASAHSQAVALQLISRACELQPKIEFDKNISLLLKAFEVPVSEGGLRDTGPGREWWFTKFAQKNSKAPRVLNGMLFALMALLDISNRHGSQFAADLYNKGAKEVLEKIDNFDSGGWTLYDDAGKLSSRHYHKIVVKQLKLLAHESGIEGFSYWGERFSRYSFEEFNMQG